MKEGACRRDGGGLKDWPPEAPFAQAMAITSAQAGVRAMTAQEVVAYAQEVAAGIRGLQGVSAAPAEPAVNPKDAVRETCVVCLESAARSSRC